MNSEYIWIGRKHINSFGSYSKFYGDYYYKSYRDGTKMYYRLKARLTYDNTTSGTGNYNDKIVAIFKMNQGSSPNYNSTKTIKPTTSGSFYDGQYWEVESDWFSLDKVDGTINCFISINNSVTWGFDSPNYEFNLDVIPALSSITVNNGSLFHVDKNENVSNEIPVTITKYVDSYTSKLKITMENNQSEQVIVRDYVDFDGDTLTFTEEELSIIYNHTPEFRLFVLIFDLDTYDGDMLIGTSTTRQGASLSETDLKPTFNDFEYADVNDITTKLTDNPQILIKGYSDVEMTVSETNKAIGRKGATIKQYTFANGTPIQDITTINYPIKTEKFKPQNKELGVTAIDSRDLSVNVVKNLANIKVSKELVIEWDGEPYGENYDYLYKISESTPSQEMLNGATVEMMGETFVLDKFNGDGKNIVAGSSVLTTFPVLVGVVTETNDEFPMSPGTYFFRYVGNYYVSKLTANINETYNNWIEYKDIEKKPFSAERKNGGTSSEVTLKLSGNIWDGNFGAVDNSIKEATYKYKKTTDTEWTSGTTKLNVVKNGSSYSLEQDIAGDLGATGFDQEESYDIYVEVSDQLSTISDTFTLGAGSPGIARYKNCVSLGAPYDESIGGRVQISKVTGTTNFETNLLKQGKEVALKEDIETIESGSNENGSWIKFPDGTMICSGEVGTGTLKWTQDSIVWVSRNFEFLDFPQEFIEPPRVIKGIQHMNTLQRNIWINGSSAPTTTNAGTYNLATYWNATGTSCTVTYIAIGKWK